MRWTEVLEYLEKISVEPQSQSPECGKLLHRLLNIFSITFIQRIERYEEKKTEEKIQKLQKFKENFKKIYEFYRKIMMNSWTSRMHVYYEMNELEAKEYDKLLDNMLRELIMELMRGEDMIEEEEEEVEKIKMMKVVTGGEGEVKKKNNERLLKEMTRMIWPPWGILFLGMVIWVTSYQSPGNGIRD